MKSLKATILLLLVTAMMLFSVGCGDKTKKNAPALDSLTAKAEAILDELPEDERISDFRTIHNLLTNLSTKEKQFLKQLEEARAIARKHGFSLESADWYFSVGSPVNSETIKDYINDRVDHDISGALTAMISPLLLQEYGYDLEHIRDVSKDDILGEVERCGYYCESIKARDSSTKSVREFWKDSRSLLGDYEVQYYENGFVDYLKIPLIKADFWKDEENANAFMDANEQKQKEILKNTIAIMLNSFNGFEKEKAVLSLIYTEEELCILENYIKSLTADVVCASKYAYSTGSSLFLCYKDTAIAINFSPGAINLTISGRNLINEFSSRWYTLQCGFAGSTKSREYFAEEYADYINKNTALNVDIPEEFIDLDAIAEEYMQETETDAPAESISIIMADGIWCDKDSCYTYGENNAMFNFIAIDNGNMYFGNYPGETSAPARIVKVTAQKENKYTITIYYEGEYIDREIQFVDNSFFFSDIPEVNYIYMGKDFEEAEQNAVKQIQEG